MSEQLRPLDYDKERAEVFYQTAVDTLPLDLRPPEDVNRAAFNDAILEGYEALAMRKHARGSIRHKALLARHTLAINFLQGISETELESEKQGVRYATKETALDVVVSVATNGAQNIGKQISQGTDMIADMVPPAEFENFESLNDLIRRLFQEKRLSEGKAKALLMLIGGEEVAVEAEQKYLIAKAIVEDLRPRLLNATIQQPHSRDQIIDKHFKKGAFYLKDIIENPIGRLNALSSKKKEASLSEKLEREQQDIDVHIGYVLDKLYK